MAERVDHGHRGLGGYDASTAQDDQLSSPSAAMVPRLVLQGRGDPEQVAGVIRANPSLHGEIVAYLQRAFGNGFVQAVVRCLHEPAQGSPAAPMSSTREGLESLNTPGAYDYRLERVERLRQDILTGSQTEISPDVPPETIALMRANVHRLTNEQLAAIQGYTSQDYKAINSAMRRPAAAPEQAARLAGYIQAISGGLDALPGYEGEVYRGTAMSKTKWAEWEQAHAAGLPVSDAAFSSSSRSEAVAEDFLDQTRDDDKVSVFCKIQSRTGRQVEFLSKTANELEVLFRGGAKFKIIYIADSAGPDGRPRKEVMLREVVDDDRTGDKQAPGAG